MPLVASSISANLERIRNQMAEACTKAGRSPASVALMAVSKMHPAEAILEAYEAGQRLFGENRVQEAQAKAQQILGLDGLELHLIGPLQNNKTSKAAELFHAVDTLDSLKTAERLNSAAQALGRQIAVLIEVKLSPEETKHGIAPEELPALLAALAALPNLQVRGLMTVPPWSEDAEAARPTLTELSMGMSNDFAVAIEEGSTCVRIGTAIFGKRNYT